MTFVKISRMINGDPLYLDNVEDILGFWELVKKWLITNQDKPWSNSTIHEEIMQELADEGQRMEHVGSDDAEETDETTEDSEVVCGADGCHIATWVENPRGFDIKDQGFRSYLDREGWFFGVQGNVLLLHDCARIGGGERLRELYSEYLASKKGASGHGEGSSDG